MDSRSGRLGGEELVWSDSPSWVVGMRAFVLGALFFWLVVPLFYAIWKWLEIRFFRYELSTERLRVTRGVFSRHTDELELYRVKDIQRFEPFMYRMFGAGNLILHTSDRSTPVLLMEGITNLDEVHEHIRSLVESLRGIKGVREID